MKRNGQRGAKNNAQTHLQPRNPGAKRELRFSPGLGHGYYLRRTGSNGIIIGNPNTGHYDGMRIKQLVRLGTIYQFTEDRLHEKPELRGLKKKPSKNAKNTPIGHDKWGQVVNLSKQARKAKMRNERAERREAHRVLRGQRKPKGAVAHVCEPEDTSFDAQLAAV